MTIGGSFQNSLETTSLLKELGAKLVISRAERDVQEKFLLRNGADKVVYPEKQVAKWASIRYTDDHILDYMEVDASHAIFEVEVPEEWTGKTVGGLDIRKRYNINILAVKNEGCLLYTSPARCLSMFLCFSDRCVLSVRYICHIVSALGFGNNISLRSQLQIGIFNGDVYKRQVRICFFL